MTFKQSCSLLLLLLVASLDKVYPVNNPVTVSEGENVHLVCNYTRKDPPVPENSTVIWKHPKGHTMSNTKGSFSLDIPNVTQNDSGRYECHIRNVGFQQNIYLNVTDRKMKKAETTEPNGGATISHLSVGFITMLFACYFFI